MSLAPFEEILFSEQLGRGKRMRSQIDIYKPAELNMVSGKEGTARYKLSERRDEIFNKLNNEEELIDQEVVNVIREIENKLRQ